ncbi:MAG: hypothetical protein HOO06_08375 [Bdellovibrionaceae bacterium]|jgi:hypothetical protein|nr:hypothetical protein [Pseudobdellovibrionaceae bacterium]
MTMSNCVIQYTGEETANEYQQAIKVIMQNIQSGSPSGSVLNLNLDNKDSSAEGKLTIVSREGSFEAKTSAKDALAVVKLLKKDVDHQIRGWLKTRDI